MKRLSIHRVRAAPGERIQTQPERAGQGDDSVPGRLILAVLVREDLPLGDAASLRELAAR